MSAFFPLAFANEELSLLTAIVLGFLFGFTLERAGFGNARKLAAQFYLHDMTVFKVMFTAIIVAMVGLYGLAALGWLDLSLLWINPTFMWSQVVGGFLLGAGFIVSGLCPGTSVVSAASGRIDGLVALVGIFVGTLLFAVTVDAFPLIARLYTAGSLGTSLLPDVFGIPALWLALIVVLGAGAAFVGAEKVERIMSARRERLELAPTVRPRLKFAVPGALALLVLGATVAPPPRHEPAAPRPVPISAGEVARRLIARDPALLLLDVRTDTAARGIPTARPVTLADSLPAALAAASPRQLVVVYDEAGALTRLPPAWPAALRYAVIAGGLAAWRREVLTPSSPANASLRERERVAEQNQLAAWFSGATVSAPSAAAPPPAVGGGGAKKKKAGGC